MEKEFRKHIKIFLFLLALIGIGIVTLCIHVYQYNKEERVLAYNAANTEETDESLDCAVTIRPRGGSSDAWVKRVNGVGEEQNPCEIQYAGIIYDVLVKNQTDKEIRDWKLKIDIKQDCFINNAWCGEIEFHQHVGGNELTQALDLRKCIENKVEYTVDAQVVGTDLMIPLESGDYFVYIPSVKDKEDTIAPSDKKTGLYQNKRVDFIAYHQIENEDMTPIEFPQAVMSYKLHKNLLDMPSFHILILLLAIWFVAAVTTFIVDIRTQRLLEQTRRDAQIIEQSISAFMGFIDAKDPSTNGHSQRVAQYSYQIAKKLGLSENESKRIQYIGMMHDCGKIGIPDAILKKPDKLTPEEYEIIKTHTTQGGRILQDFTSIDNMREGALYHHERYDGTGYPQGLKGEEIPLVARIICVADSFDVMNSKRCYKNKLTKEDILEQMNKNRGIQFDPKIVDCFMELIEEGSIKI